MDKIRPPRCSMSLLLYWKTFHAFLPLKRKFATAFKRTENLFENLKWLLGPHATIIARSRTISFGKLGKGGLRSHSIRRSINPRIHPRLLLSMDRNFSRESRKFAFSTCNLTCIVDRYRFVSFQYGLDKPNTDNTCPWRHWKTHQVRATKVTGVLQIFTRICKDCASRIGG